MSLPYVPPLHADADWATRRHDLAGWRDGPDLPWGHPDFVLAAAVRQGILTRILSWLRIL